MDIKEVVIDLIEKSEIAGMQKNVAKGMIIRGMDMIAANSAERRLVESFEKGHFSIAMSNENMIMYKIVNSKDDWDIKYPYRTIFKDAKGDWRRVNTVSDTVDNAYLVYLEKKHLGDNSQFSLFAMKMLEIEIPE